MDFLFSVGGPKRLTSFVVIFHVITGGGGKVLGFVGEDRRTMEFFGTRCTSDIWNPKNFAKKILGTSGSSYDVAKSVKSI